MQPSKIKQKCGSNHAHESQSEADRCRGFLEQVKRGEIRGFLWQKSVDIGSGKKWCIDFEVWDNDGTNSYHEHKPWKKIDENAAYRSLLFRKNRSERLFINETLARPFDETARSILRYIERRLRDRKKWVTKIKNQIKSRRKEK